MFEPRSPSDAAALVVRKCNLNLFPNEIVDNNDDKTAHKQSVMTVTVDVIFFLLKRAAL